MSSSSDYTSSLRIRQSVQNSTVSSSDNTTLKQLDAIQCEDGYLFNIAIPDLNPIMHIRNTAPPKYCSSRLTYKTPVYNKTSTSACITSYYYTTKGAKVEKTCYTYKK